MDAYEKILSYNLRHPDWTSPGSGSAQPLETQENEIEEESDKRWLQMEKIVQMGLERTEKGADTMGKINDAMQIVGPLKDLVSMAVQACPQAAIAWTGVCFAIQVSPSSQN